MACFIVPAAEALIVSAGKKLIEHHEKKFGIKGGICLSEKIGQLNKMLWGGSVLLAFEHLWHGEITPFFPFFTAASDPAETAEMLHETASSGTAMAALVTAVWICITLVSAAVQNREDTASGNAFGGSEQ